jgi:hypothetical protein
MALFSRQKPAPAKPVRERRPTAADRALEGLELRRISWPELPVPNKARVPVPVESANRAAVHAEAKLATQHAAERVKRAEQAVSAADHELTKVRARVRFGEAGPGDIKQATAAVDAATAELQEAQRDRAGGALLVLDERQYIEKQALIEANRDRQAEELRGLATCLAEERQLEQRLAIVKACRLAFTDSVHALTFTHPHPDDSPICEHAQHLIERARLIVADRLGLDAKAAPIRVSYHEDVPAIRAQERAILDEAQRQAKRRRA